jgi:tyrosyl-tRNA synthetase
MSLAHEIVAIFHNEAAALAAEEAFKKVFQQKDIPNNIPEFAFQPGQTVLEVLVATGLVTSKNEGRRLIEQKGVKLDGEILEKFEAALPHTGVLQVGKRRFIRVK